MKAELIPILHGVRAPANLSFFAKKNLQQEISHHGNKIFNGSCNLSRARKLFWGENFGLLKSRFPSQNFTVTKW